MVQLGTFHPRSHEHQPASPLELCEGGLDGGGLAGALECHVVGVLTHEIRHGRPLELLGLDGARGPEPLRQRPTHGRGLAYGDVVHPSCSERREREASDGTGPRDQRSLPGPDLAQRDRVQHYRHGLGQRSDPQREPLGHALELFLVHAYVLRERALVLSLCAQPIPSGTE